MKIVRALVLTAAMALVGSFSAVPAVAQTPSPEALQAARELTTITSGSVIAELTTNLTKEVWPTVEATLRVRNPKIDASTLAELRKEFERLQVNAITEALQDAAPIYARHFTVEELRAITAFYRTPVGAKTLAVMPKATVELLQGLGPRLQRLSEGVNQRFAAILQQRGYNP